MKVSTLAFLTASWFAQGVWAGESPLSWPDSSETPLDYQLTMTWISGDTRFATIDGGFYRQGDRLPDGTTLASIQSGGILLTKDGGELWVQMVDEPPLPPLPMDQDPALAPLAYLGEAVERLHNEVENRAGPEEALAKLETLKQRLAAAQERLATGDISDEEMAAIDSELNIEWLQAQRKLDALRDRISNSGQGLNMEQLSATQAILEEAVMATLREPLAKVQNPEFQGLINLQSGQLLQTVTALLGSYPDYQAIADKLQQAQNQ